MDLNTEIKQSRLKNTLILISSFTLLFAVGVVGIFGIFIASGKSLINIYDGYDQGYFWTVELKKNLQSLLAGNGYPGWSWSKGPGMEVKAITDPFMVLAALFPVGKIELGYSIATILRLYFSGLAFMAFVKTVKLSNFQAILGAVCYTFSGWILMVSLVQAQFVNITILLPILILAIDRVYQGKSPVLFMITVACTMISSIYLAYMAGLIAVVYILLRYFTYNSFGIRDYLKWIGKFIGYGIVGIATSLVVTITTIQSLLGASTGSSSNKYDTFQSLDFILNLGNTFVSKGYNFSYGYIGIPVIAILGIFVSYRYFSGKKTNLIITVILIVMMFFPFCSSMFNGFGYVTTRWYFLLIFFLIWTAAESFDLDRLAEIPNLVIMALGLCVVAAATLGFAYLNITGNYSSSEIKFIFCAIAAGIIIFIIVASGIKSIVPLRVRQVAVLTVTIVTLAGSWGYTLKAHDGNFVDLGGMNNSLSKSTQRAGSQISDTGFYRIDQVDGININHQADQPANENLWWGTKTLYLYDSKVPSRLSEFNKIMGNNYGYSKRVYVLSNGQRMGLDFLYGVKYFLGDDTRNGTDGSDEFAGYGFQFMKNIDGVNVFKNKYDSGLGFEYNKVISESEFMKLSRDAREQAILQAMVVPDDEIADIDQSMIVTADDMDIDIDNVKYQIEDGDGVTIKGNTITVDKEEGYCYLRVSDIKNSQMVVSFDNLVRRDSEGNDIGDFYIKCSNSKRTAAANNKKNNQTIAGIVDYDMNLGYYDNYSGKIKLKFLNTGTYTFDKLYINAMATSNYDKYAKERLANKYEITSYSDSKVTGKVNASDDGYVYFSIPSYKNWDVYVDGQKTDKVTNANITFMAVKVTSGTHTIVLEHHVKYHNIAMIISILALAGIIIIGIIHRRSNKKQFKRGEKS